MAIRKTLLQIIQNAHLCSDEELNRYIDESKHSGTNIARYLFEQGVITEDKLAKIYAEQLGFPYVDDIGKLNLSPEFVAKYSIKEMRRHGWVPIRLVDEKTVLIGASYPNTLEFDKSINKSFEKLNKQVIILKESDIDDWIDRRAGSLAVDTDRFDEIEGFENITEEAFNITDGEDDAAVVSIVNELFSSAIKSKASDIHIAPDVSGIDVRFRLDGILKRMGVWPAKIHQSLITRIKLMGGMDIAEQRRPQSGRIQLVSNGVDIDIRVSTLPTTYGEKATLRILDKTNSTFDITMLGMLPETEEKFRELITHTSGIILVTGPTGSGKSTSLYAAMSELNREDVCIVTLEDPVEYKVEGIAQVQVNPEAGLDFAAGLREILRQDPDIILIGEIRDSETAHIATQASNTGHLVFATLHTNDAPSSVIRLIEMGVEPFMVSSALIGVMNQRLVRRVCPECKKEYLLGTDEKDMKIRKYMGVGPDEEVKLYKGTGCDHCNNTGYRGRVPIQEFMIIDDDIREALANNATPVELRKLAIQNGMNTLKIDGIKKAKLGITSIDEIRRVVS